MGNIVCHIGIATSDLRIWGAIFWYFRRKLISGAQFNTYVNAVVELPMDWNQLETALSPITNPSKVQSLFPQNRALFF